MPHLSPQLPTCLPPTPPRGGGVVWVKKWNKGHRDEDRKVGVRVRRQKREKKLNRKWRMEAVGYAGWNRMWRQARKGVERGRQEVGGEAG